MRPNWNSPWSILLYTWLVVSTFANIVALASLADGIIAWSGFVQAMIDSYRQIRDVVWGNFFSVIDINVPTWIHDYLTVNSIFAISILWGMINASKSIQSEELGSVTQYLRNSILDFTVGGSITKSFADDAIDRLQASKLENEKEVVGKLRKLGRPIVSVYTVSKTLLMALLALISYLGFAFLFPWIIQLNDRWDANLATFEFRRLRTKVKAIPLKAPEHESVLSAFDSSTATFAAFEAMDNLFHHTLQRSLLRYLIAVALLFVLLVFSNQVILKVASSM